MGIPRIFRNLQYWTYYIITRNHYIITIITINHFGVSVLISVIHVMSHASYRSQFVGDLSVELAGTFACSIHSQIDSGSHESALK